MTNQTRVLLISQSIFFLPGKKRVFLKDKGLWKENCAELILYQQELRVEFFTTIYGMRYHISLIYDYINSITQVFTHTRPQ